MAIVTIITPTGNRRVAFGICEKLMAKQTYRGELQWIVVDDCEPRTECHLGQEVVHPTPTWTGQNTQCRNLLVGLYHTKGDKVLIVEDDDYYAPTYIEEMCKRLDTAPLVGEVSARYYHVKKRAYLEFKNLYYSSLCQAGLRQEIIQTLVTVCRTQQSFVDVNLFQKVKSAKLFKQTNLSIGIKGLPGRPGIGVGHRDSSRYRSDPDMKVLYEWIGGDAEIYKEFYQNGN